MDNDQERDIVEEEYWRNHCPECDHSPCDCYKFYCVSIYMTDRQYGGGEEGGWWYNVGEPVKELAMHTRIFNNLIEAQDYAESLRAYLIPDLNVGRRDISSVLCDGVYEAIIDYDEYPSAYPKETPHYE